MGHPDTLPFIIIMVTFVFCIYLIEFVTATTQGNSWFSGEVKNEAEVG